MLSDEYKAEDLLYPCLPRGYIVCRPRGYEKKRRKKKGSKHLSRVDFLFEHSPPAKTPEDNGHSDDRMEGAKLPHNGSRDYCNYNI